jgi:glycosyltransferase involved in cell wall biosynthesis
MMAPFGYEIIEYSNEGSQSLANEHIPILREKEFRKLRDLYNKEYPNDFANTSSSIFEEFHNKLIREVAKRAQPGEIICHPFGNVHGALGEILPNCFHVETGIGYVNLASFTYKVFESYAWMHYQQGIADRWGNNYEFVVPMSYDLEEWVPSYETGKYILYFGRITEDKGMNYIREIAKRVDMEVIICGGGDVAPWLDPEIPNLKYLAPVNGLARSELLRNAYCMLMPTTYTEPFGSAGVEGMLCGTPLIASDFGAFTETIWQGVTGFRCKTLGDWLYAVKEVKNLDRAKIAEITRHKYDMKRCGKLMDSVFRQIITMNKEDGWYDLEPFMAIPEYKPDPSLLLNNPVLETQHY